MSLFSSIHVARSGLQAAQAGIQVAGNNISNADNAEYIRQRLQTVTGPPYQQQGVVHGSGVRVLGVRQQIDLLVEKEFRQAGSDLSLASTRLDGLENLESILGALSENGLPAVLGAFFDRLQDVAEDPRNLALRRQAIVQAQTLASTFRNLRDRVARQQADTDRQIAQTAERLSELAAEIADLNRRILAVEADSRSDAVGLRDRRLEALRTLAQEIDITVAEQDDGTVDVFAGGDFLVMGTSARSVFAEIVADGQSARTEIFLDGSLTRLQPATGRLAALYQLA